MSEQTSGGSNSVANSVAEVAPEDSHPRKKISDAKKMDADLGNPNPPERITMLPRGGVYVETAAGPIQYGMPPETVKDCMTLGIGVPRHFIVPSERFNTQLGPSVGINVAEFEFPAYFNFFFKRRSVNLIVPSQEVEDRIREVFQETLFGPLEIDMDGDYVQEFPVGKRADLLKELTYFRKFGDKLMTIDMLLSFTHFNSAGLVTISAAEGEGSVTIKLEDDKFTFTENGAVIALFEDTVTLPPAPLGRMQVDVMGAFQPPAFGVTTLGNSHGFDPSGSTSGYVLWINRRGIMIDPPPQSTTVLEQSHVPPSAIDGVIVTHCHADHDAGTFQKILMEGKVMLMTTATIHDSFVRKYSALSGLGSDVLTAAFNFRRVRVGERVRVRGAELAFNYMLHSIPCIGVEVWYKGKSIVFSADHMNDTTKIPQLHAEGVVSDGRRDDLLNFPWHHDIVLHEAGVPPIHTPMATLEALDSAIKERLYVVHVAGKDIPTDKGLKGAPLGVAGTLRLDVEHNSPYDAATDVLALLHRHHLFSMLSFESSRDLLQTVEQRSFEPGAVVWEQGQLSPGFLLLLRGEATCSDGSVFRPGDLVNERCLVDLHHCVSATMTVSSEIAMDVLWFSHVDLHWLLCNDGSVSTVERMFSIKETVNWESINRNQTLRLLTDTQKFQLEALFHRRSCKRGEELWTQGSPCESAVLVQEGSLRLYLGANLSAGVSRRSVRVLPSTLRRGAFVGDFQAIVAGAAHNSTLVSDSDSVLLEVSSRDLVSFFQRNPGVLLSVVSTIAVV